MLGHEPGAVEDVLEVPLGEALPLRDHAESVRSGGLGRARMLEDLVRLHHRVHRRVRLGEARLRAEATVLRAAAGLGVHERAEVGGVAEALEPDLPGPVDQCLDLGTILDLAEPERLFTGDEGRHAAVTVRAPGRHLAVAGANVEMVTDTVASTGSASSASCPLRLPELRCHSLGPCGRARAASARDSRRPCSRSRRATGTSPGASWASSRSSLRRARSAGRAPPRAPRDGPGSGSP